MWSWGCFVPPWCKSLGDLHQSASSEDWLSSNCADRKVQVHPDGVLGPASQVGEAAALFSSSARWLWLTEPKCATDDGRVTWEAPRKCRNDEIYSSFLKRILVYSDTVYRAGVFQARNMISMLVVCRLSFCHAAQSDNMVKAVDAAYHECVYSLNCASKPTKCGSSFHQVDRTDIRSCVTRGITRTYSICLTHEDTVGAAVPAIHICCPYSRESP